MPARGYGPEGASSANAVSTTPPAIIDAAGNEIGKTGDLIVSGCYDLVQNAYQIDGSDLRPSGVSLPIRFS